MRFKSAHQAARSDLSMQLSSDLAENAAQLVKIHRLGEMKIESSFSAALDIVTPGKSRERHGLEGSFSFRLGNNVVTITIRQRNIAQHDVELFRVNHVQRAPGVIGSGNFMAEMIQKARQSFQSVAVIFYHQDTQTVARIIRCPRPLLAHLFRSLEAL